jgi:hypothetical protein
MMSASDTLALLAVIVAAISAGSAVTAVYFARKNVKIADDSYQLNRQASERATRSADMQIRMFQRQQVIDVFRAWSTVPAIDGTALQASDAARAANVLELTATLWNHDIVDKEILCQNYWIPFRDIYDRLYSIHSVIPGGTKTGREYLSNETEHAYSEMKQRCLIDNVRTSTIQ